MALSYEKDCLLMSALRYIIFPTLRSGCGLISTWNPSCVNGACFSRSTCAVYDLALSMFFLVHFQALRLF